MQLRLLPSTMPWTQSVRSWSSSDERHAASKIKDLYFNSPGRKRRNGTHKCHKTLILISCHAKMLVTPHADHEFFRREIRVVGLRCSRHTVADKVAPAPTPPCMPAPWATLLLRSKRAPLSSRKPPCKDIGHHLHDIPLLHAFS